MRFSFTQQERRDLAKSWILVSVAFAIFMTGISFSAGFARVFTFSLATAALTVGIGFLAHELAHKWVANNHNCYAEYRADTMMLLISLILSPFHVFIAAPGAVHISGHANHEEQGKISLAGPGANLVLALLFLILFYAIPNATLSRAAGLGLIINSSLALFNLIPFSIFDGTKILAWDKTVYGFAAAAAVVMTFFSYIVVQARLGLF